MRRSHDGYRILGGIPSLDIGRGLRVDQMVMRQLRSQVQISVREGGVQGGDSPPDSRVQGAQAPDGGLGAKPPAVGAGGYQ